MTVPEMLVPADLASHKPRSYEDALIDRCERLYRTMPAKRWQAPRLFISVTDDGQMRESVAGPDIASVVDLALDRNYVGTVVLQAGKMPRIIDLSDHAHTLEAEREAEYQNERKYGFRPSISRGMS